MGSNSSGLFVLAGENGSRRGILDPAIYREATMRLDRHFTISIVDCGSTMDAPGHPGGHAGHGRADRRVFAVARWGGVGGRADHGMACCPWQDRTDAAFGDRAQRLRRPFRQEDPRGGAGRPVPLPSQAVVEVPFDPGLRPGGVINNTGEMSLRPAAHSSKWQRSFRSSWRPSRPVDPPVSIDGYVIESVLGTGGTGTVYLARHERVLVALKVLTAECPPAPPLRHPHIAQVYEAGGRLPDGRHWLAMQYLAGGDADSELRAGRMSPARAVQIIADVAAALDFAHDRDVVHG